MNGNIHNVTKILLGEIQSLGDTTFTRDFKVFTEDDKEVFELTLFADNKKNLKVTITEEKRI